MTDIRIERMAKVLVHYCLELQPGKTLQIVSSCLAEPLIREVYREALLAGAFPDTKIGINGLARIMFKYASDEQLRFVSEMEQLEAEKLDAVLAITAQWNTRGLTGVDPRRVTLPQAARRELIQRFMERSAQGSLRWCGTLFPTNAAAQEAEMALEDYEDFVFGAMLVDRDDPTAEWQRISREQDRLIQYLKGVKTLRIRARDTDLELRCEGRTWVNCDGRQNFPDGEVFTAPIEDSVQGSIRFSFPAIQAGRGVDDVRLRFEQGRVVEATAAKAEDFLLTTIDVDAGARFCGEFAFGTNDGIQRFTRNTLFDEKIGGTCHLALGAAPPEAGGKNQSAIHWDMVCDLRQGGEVYADGELIQKDGKWRI